MDNCDFAEDTPHGKSTLHGTSLAVYQQKQPGDVQKPFKIDEGVNKLTLDQLPESMTELLPFNAASITKPTTPIYPDRSFLDQESFDDATLHDVIWMAGATMFDLTPGHDKSESQVPPWSAYHSLLSTPLPLTTVCTPPLIPAPAHELRTLFTALRQVQDINESIVGQGKYTVVTLDMGLYQPAQQLVLSRNDLNNIILRPGELHIVMAMLRTIGSYMTNSGLDASWIEADMYGSTTCKNILDGGHVKRAVEAHSVTLLALFRLYVGSLFEGDFEGDEIVRQGSDALNSAFESQSDIIETHHRVFHELKSIDILQQMQNFDRQAGVNPMLFAMRQYMEMVLVMLQFIKSFHTANWILHLDSLERFTKYFFAMDKLNYSRMIPLYLAQMRQVEIEQPEVWTEFINGNWVVNRNTIPFCAIGADHALEHVNRAMKVSGGIIGITLNENARARFFLSSPQLIAIREEALTLMGSKFKATDTKEFKHHQNNVAARQRLNKNVSALTDAMKKSGDPFSHDTNDVINLVTKEVMPEAIKEGILTLTDVGLELFRKFKQERILSNEVPLWASMKRRKLQLWSASAKKARYSDQGQVIELKEDRNLFARLLIAARSRPEINIQEIISTYELSVVPRSLFNSDGSLSHNTSKSQLMHIVENHVQACVENVAETKLTRNRRVAVIDAMAEVQAMGKPYWVKTCHDLGNHLIDVIRRKYLAQSSFDEVHVKVDRYDIDHSLKTAARKIRLGKQVPVAYHITDNTDITNVPLTKLLSHVSTKHELTVYLGNHLLRYSSTLESVTIIVAYQDQALCNTMNVEHLCSTQEEADTKLLLHAIDATCRGSTEMWIYSPDTDVFILCILCIRRSQDLPESTFFLTGTGTNFRNINISQLARGLSIEMAQALPGLHALSGADITGSFSGKGKKSFWKAFLSSDSDILGALTKLGDHPMDDNTMQQLERFVCKVYLPGTDINDVGKLRWHLFRQYQKESDKLPPTRASLTEAFRRANYQTMIWSSDIVANPTLPSPVGFGWREEGGVWIPEMTTLPPAPLAGLQLVHCNCQTSKCLTNRCKCRSNALNCTEPFEMSRSNENSSFIQNKRTIQVYL